MPSDYSTLYSSRYGSSRSARRYDSDSLSPNRRRSRSPPRSSSSGYDRSDDNGYSSRNNDDLSSGSIRDLRRSRPREPDDLPFDDLNISRSRYDRQDDYRSTRSRRSRSPKAEDLRIDSLRIAEDNDRWYRDRTDIGSGYRSSWRERSHAPSRVSSLRDESRYPDYSSSFSSSRYRSAVASPASGTSTSRYGEFSSYLDEGYGRSSDFDRDNDAYSRYNRRRRGSNGWDFD